MFTAAVLSFAMLYWLHGKTLPETSSGLEYMSRMGGSSFLSHGLFPQSRAFLISLVQNPVHWILTALGYVAIRSQMRGQDRTARWQSLCKLTFAFPLLCLIFYRHSHPYFYVFMLAPVSIFIAASVQHFIIERRPKALPPLLGVLMLWIGGVFFFSLQQGQSYQRQTVDLVHDIFPQPVPYLDYSAMISSFPRIEEGGIFINTQTLDMRAYYRAGQPIMGDILRRHQPKFLIANVTGLDLDGRDKHANNNQLLPSDTAILKDNFTWFWGPLYLPAKSIPADASEIEILVAGDYTYYGDQTTLDGKTVNDRDVITLSQGKFKSQSQNGGILKWGNHLSPPESPAPNQMLFHGF